jgi:hypothetical protein
MHIMKVVKITGDNITMKLLIQNNANNKPNPFSLSMESYGLHIKI